MKKKLAIISLNLPFPLNNGGAIAQYFFLKKFQHIYDLTFITTVNEKEAENYLNELKKKLPKINFIVFKDYQEKQTKPNVILSLKIFLYNLLYSKKKNQNNIQENPILYVFSTTNFKNFIIKHFQINQYDYIQCEFFETIDLIDFLPKDNKTIFIHHEIRFKSIELQKSKNISIDWIMNLKKMELDYLKKFQKIVVFNLNDKLLLEKDIQKEKLIISEFGILSDNIYKSSVSETFNKLVFTGGQSHYSNYEGLKWFLDTIYLPNYDRISFEMFIVGKWREDFKENYKKFTKIKFLGLVDGLGTAFENAVLLNPILSGSGIRTKVLEAFANRVPVISTPIGAEGLYSETEHNHLMIFENEEEFLRIFENYFSNNNLAELSEKGFEYYQKYFNEELLLQKRIQIYE